MKRILLTIISILSIIIMNAQVSQNIIVEHYTNTKCGTCASKNPAFFTLLENYEEIHLAYYPSSPFSTCIFSLHNKFEADARTEYYNIFGSTPRVVLNGEVVPTSSQLLNESRIDAEVPNTTPFTINIEQEYIDNSSVKVIITVKTISATSISNLTMHAMLAEKLIEYDAPNGETEHPDVFRKALYGSDGISFSVAIIDSSVIFEKTYTFDPDWVKEDMEVIAFIQDETDKSIKQAGISSKLGEFSEETIINTFENLELSFYPNPVNNVINLKTNKINNYNVTIYDMIGKKIIEYKSSKTIDVSTLAKGAYFLEIIIDNQKFVSRFYKK